MVGSIKTKPMLLIAEDDPENQSFLKLLLSRHFSIDLCDSADSFYKLIKRNNYDIILMDISLKGNKNGLELTKEIKSDSTTSAIPVICYTAHAFNADKNNALDAGCDAYISKPSDVYTLLNSLFSFLQKRNSSFSLQDSGTGLAPA